MEKFCNNGNKINIEEAYKSLTKTNTITFKEFYEWAINLNNEKEDNFDEDEELNLIRKSSSGLDKRSDLMRSPSKKHSIIKVKNISDVNWNELGDKMPILKTREETHLQTQK